MLLVLCGQLVCLFVIFVSVPPRDTLSPLDRLKRAWTTPPVIDKDPFWVNYILHPLAGAAYFVGAFKAGCDLPTAFFATCVASCVWEYVIEATLEQPSIQDLIVTPVCGAVLGSLLILSTGGGPGTGYVPRAQDQVNFPKTPNILLV